MPEFSLSIENFDYLMIVDAAVILLMSALVFIFCKRRSNLKLFFLTVFLIANYVAVFVLRLGFSKSPALSVTSTLIELAIVVLAVATAVAYQTDIKSAFARMSRRKKNKAYDYDSSEDELRLAASEIIKACQTLSKNDIGALIIVAPSAVPRRILDTGTEIGAVITSGLLESIFNTKAPLHDGAVIIKENRILAAGCFLPLSENVTISKDLGTRHRAAIGITEESDVLAIVVSEETGIISTAKGGALKRYMTPEKLFEEIEEAYSISYRRKDDETDF